MSLQDNPFYNTPEIISALEAHGLEVEKPSQLSDAFRLGYFAAIRNAVNISNECKPDRPLQSRAKAGQIATEINKLITPQGNDKC